MIEEDSYISLTTGEAAPSQGPDVSVAFYKDEGPTIHEWDEEGDFAGSTELTAEQMDRLVSLWQQWKSQTQEAALQMPEDTMLSEDILVGGTDGGNYMVSQRAFKWNGEEAWQTLLLSTEELDRITEWWRHQKYQTQGG